MDQENQIKYSLQPAEILPLDLRYGNRERIPVELRWIERWMATVAAAEREKLETLIKKSGVIDDYPKKYRRIATFPLESHGSQYLRKPPENQVEPFHNPEVILSVVLPSAAVADFFNDFRSIFFFDYLQVNLVEHGPLIKQSALTRIQTLRSMMAYTHQLFHPITDLLAIDLTTIESIVRSPAFTEHTSMGATMNEIFTIINRCNGEINQTQDSLLDDIITISNLYYYTNIQNLARLKSFTTSL